MKLNVITLETLQEHIFNCVIFVQRQTFQLHIHIGDIRRQCIFIGLNVTWKHIKKKH